MNKEPLWYAVYTRPRWEKKVASLMAKKGIEHYCPLNKVVRQWSDRKKIILEPLFKSYVFIRITQEGLLKVRQTDGVLNLVYWLGKPAVIRDEEIETIQRFLNEHENVLLEKTEVNINDEVCIMTGPFLDHKGRVIEITNKLVKVHLPSLGYAMVAKVARESVRVIPIEIVNSQ
jgi:transcription antitermination factor NusG